MMLGLEEMNHLKRGIVESEDVFAFVMGIVLNLVAVARVELERLPRLQCMLCHVRLLPGLVPGYLPFERGGDAVAPEITRPFSGNGIDWAGTGQEFRE
jgi:hypothetical protein